jgi:hypothetical protein
MFINVLLRSVLKEKSPYQMLFNQELNYLNFHSFGCVIYPLLQPYNAHKFSYRTTTCFNLGLGPNHSTYRCYDKESGRIYLVRHVRIHDTIFPYDVFFFFLQLSPRTPLQLHSSRYTMFSRPVCPLH